MALSNSTLLTLLKNCRFSEHFTCYELFRSSVADRLGLLNFPEDNILEVLQNLNTTCKFLEDFRFYLGNPLIISSGYRHPSINAYLVKSGSGAVPDSLHQRGLAVDIKIDRLPVNYYLASLKIAIAKSVLSKDYDITYIDYTVKSTPKNIIHIQLKPYN